MSQQTTEELAICSSPELEEAYTDLLASNRIVEILDEAMTTARKQQRESRDKYIALCGKVVAQ